jgi:hypothetical protein
MSDFRWSQSPDLLASVPAFHAQNRAKIVYAGSDPEFAVYARAVRA